LPSQKQWGVCWRGKKRTEDGKGRKKSRREGISSNTGLKTKFSKKKKSWPEKKPVVKGPNRATGERGRRNGGRRGLAWTTGAVLKAPILGKEYNQGPEDFLEFGLMREQPLEK